MRYLQIDERAEGMIYHRAGEAQVPDRLGQLVNLGMGGVAEEQSGAHFLAHRDDLKDFGLQVARFVQQIVAAGQRVFP